MHQDVAQAADAVGINRTIAFKACTGYSNKTDGAVGRAAFLKWLEGARSDHGAPCCGGQIVAGSKTLQPLPQVEEELKTLDELSEQINLLKRKLEKAQTAVRLADLLNGSEAKPEEPSKQRRLTKEERSAIHT